MPEFCYKQEQVEQLDLVLRGGSTMCVRDLFRAAELVAEKSRIAENSVKFATASRLLQLMEKSEQQFVKSRDCSSRITYLPPQARVYFRAHPKVRKMNTGCE